MSAEKRWSGLKKSDKPKSQACLERRAHKATQWTNLARVLARLVASERPRDPRGKAGEQCTHSLSHPGKAELRTLRLAASVSSVSRKFSAGGAQTARTTQ